MTKKMKTARTNTFLTPALEEERSELGGVESVTSTSENNSLDQVVPSHLSKRAVGTTLCLILSVGLLTSGAFLWFGLSTAIHEERTEFLRAALEASNQIQSSFDDYVVATSFVHLRCRHRDFSRPDFVETYEYLVDSGLEFLAAAFHPRVLREEREEYEAEAREFIEEFHPHLNYVGFKGFNYENSTGLEPRIEADFYYPIQYSK